MAALLGASNPLIGFLIPIVLVERLWHRARPAAVQIGIGIGVALQILVARLSSTVLPDPKLSMGVSFTTLPSVLVLWFDRALAPLFIGEPLALRWGARLSPVWTLFASALCVALFALALARAQAQTRARALCAALVILVELAAPLVSRRAGYDTGIEGYFFVPALATAYLFALGLEALLPRARELLRGAALLLLFSLGAMGNFAAAPLVDMRWQERWPEVARWAESRREHRATQSVLIPVSPAPRNLVLPGTLVDPGFESGKDGWLFDEGARAWTSGAQPHSGQASLMMMSRGPGDVDVQQFVEAAPGVRYRASAWVRVGCGQEQVLAELFLHDGRGGPVVRAHASEAPCGEWQQVSAEYTGSASGYAQLNLMCNQCPLGVSWDDVELTPSRAPGTSAQSGPTPPPP